MKKIIIRIKGGIGNQLFCYAAARRLAIINNATLIIDNVTGFERDLQYNRKYMLDHFNINSKKIKKHQILWPFHRFWLKFLNLISNNLDFSERFYIEQNIMDYDERLLNLKLKKSVYIDGYWQSESYFKDIEDIIRNDLKIKPPVDLLNQNLAKQIKNVESVAVHVRWFDAPENQATHNVNLDYYKRSIAIIEDKVSNPHYFLFSDNTLAAKSKLNLPEERVTLISHNKGDENAYADLWLMSQCHHFIIANSTFSWWGAWLSNYPEKIILTPDLNLNGLTAWGFKGLIPNHWNKV